MEDPFSERLYPRDYVQLLEERVAQLEKALLVYRPDIGLDHMSQDGNVAGADDVADPGAAGDAGAARDVGAPEASEAVGAGVTRGSTFSEHVGAKHIKREEPIDITLDGKGRSRQTSHEYDEIASGIGILALSASSEHHFMGSSSGLTFARVLGRTLQMEVPSPITSQPEYKMYERIIKSQVKEAPIPSEDISDELVTSYFGWMQWQYPLLDRPLFMERLATVLLLQDEAQSEDLFQVNMVWAIGAKFLEPMHYNHQSQYSSRAFYLSALKHIDSVLARDDTRCVQALFMLAMYSLQSRSGQSLWRLVGMALNTAMQQGLHRDARLHRDRLRWSASETELRSRLFWSIYALDRSDSFLLGRPTRIHDDEIDAQLPDPSAVEYVVDDRAAVLIFRATIELRRLQGEVRSYLCRRVTKDPKRRQRQKRKYLERLDAAWAEVPKTLDVKNLRGDPYSNLELIYQNTIFTLTRSSLIDGTKVEDLTEYIPLLIRAVSRMLDLFGKQQANGSLRHTYYTMHHIYGAGITLLYCLWSQGDYMVQSPELMNEISTHVKKCSSLLNVMAYRWPDAQSFSENYSVLSEAFFASDWSAMKEQPRRRVEALDNDRLVDAQTDPCISNMLLEIMGHESIKEVGFYLDADYKLDF